jgi:hypothetical protein
MDAPDEGSAIRAVAVADQVAWRLVPVRHQFETGVFNDIASASPSLRTSQLGSCGM